MMEHHTSKQDKPNGIEIAAKAQFNSRVFLAFLTLGGGAGTFGWVFTSNTDLELREQLTQCSAKVHQYESRITAWEDWAKKVKIKIPAKYAVDGPAWIGDWKFD